MALYRFLFAPVLLAVAVVWSPAEHDGASEHAAAAAPPPVVERAAATSRGDVPQTDPVDPVPAAVR